MYKVGDLVDAIDLESIWREAQVLQLFQDSGEMEVHFLGWSFNWNERVSFERVAPLHTKTQDWRKNIKRGDKVEVNIIPHIPRWLEGEVLERYGDIVDVAVSKSNSIIFKEFNLNDHNMIVGCNTHFSVKYPIHREIDIPERHIHWLVYSNNIYSLTQNLDRYPYLINEPSTHGTPVILAIKNNHREVVSLLLERGCDINHKQCSILSLVIRSNLSEKEALIEKLLLMGADPNQKDLCRESTALHLAVMRNMKDIVDLLMKHGADVNIADISLATPVRHVVYRGYVDLLKQLINYGADINYGLGVGEVAMIREVDKKDVVLDILDTSRKLKYIPYLPVKKAITNIIHSYLW